MRKGVLLDDVYVPGGDRATGIDIIAEVCACHWLKGLRFTEISVTAGHNSTGVHVAEKYTHRDGNAADICAIVNAGQVYCDDLGVRHAGAVHCHVITGDAGGGRVSGTGGGRDCTNCSGEANDNSV